MKRLRWFTLLLSFVSVLGATPSGASTTWANATKLVLPSGNNGVANGYFPELSCWSAGNCAAAGAYFDSNGLFQGVGAIEVNGTWQSATRLVPPSDAATSPGTTVFSLSCVAGGTCVGVGTYTTTNATTAAFVIHESAGTWAHATGVLLPSDASTSNQSAQLRAVTCVNATNCVAVGSYLDNSGAVRSMVVDETGGVWQSGQALTLPESLNLNPYATLMQVACASVGNCVAIGSYVDANNHSHGLEALMRNGTWQSAQAMALPGNASNFPGATLNEITCARGGSCVVEGTYNTAAGHTVGVVDSETNGTWSTPRALTMPANAAASPHVTYYGFAGISCASSGNCTTGGQYVDNQGHYQGFLVNEVSGVWQRATELAVPAGTQAGKNGGVVSLSCPRAGTCVAGAAYLDNGGNYQVLLVSEVNGHWQHPTTVTLPGSATSVGVYGGVYAVVCPTTTSCTAVGSYLSGSNYEAFAVSGH